MCTHTQLQQLRKIYIHTHSPIIIIMCTCIHTCTCTCTYNVHLHLHVHVPACQAHNTMHTQTYSHPVYSTQTTWDYLWRYWTCAVRMKCTCTFLTLYNPHDQFFNRMGKLWIGLETLLEALVVVLLGALLDGGDGREGGDGEVLSRLKTRLIITLLAAWGEGQCLHTLVAGYQLSIHRCTCTCTCKLKARYHRYKCTCTSIQTPCTEHAV